MEVFRAEAEISGMETVFKIIDGYQIKLDKMSNNKEGTPTPFDY